MILMLTPTAITLDLLLHLRLQAWAWFISYRPFGFLIQGSKTAVESWKEVELHILSF